MPHFNHFDFIAPVYDQVISPPDPERLLKLAGLPISGRLLDVGGGTGRISYALRKWVTGIVVADSSFGMLEQAKKKSGLSIVCVNAEELSFPSESFERVIMVDALHHVRDYRATAEELWRLVRPGGRIIIEEPDIRSMSTKFMAVAEKIMLMRSHFVSPPAMEGLFRYANASVHIEKERSTCWIMIDKLRGGQQSFSLG